MQSKSRVLVSAFVACAVAGAAHAQGVTFPVTQMKAAMEQQALNVFNRDPAAKDWTFLGVSGFEIVDFQLPRLTVQYKATTDQPGFYTACLTPMNDVPFKLTVTSDTSSSVSVETTNTVGVEARMGGEIAGIGAEVGGSWERAVTTGRETTQGESRTEEQEYPVTLAVGEGVVVVPSQGYYDLTNVAYTVKVRPTAFKIAPKLRPQLVEEVDLTAAAQKAGVAIQDVTLNGVFHEGYVNVRGGLVPVRMTEADVKAACASAQNQEPQATVAGALPPAQRVKLGLQPGARLSH